MTGPAPGGGDGTVRVERHGAVAVIGMLREHKRNAVDAAMAYRLDAAMHEVEADPGVRVAVLTGTATVFCAGTDLLDPADKRTPDGGEYGLIRRPRTKPLIAAVEGVAAGGGFEIAMACDLVVASTTARFSLPETRRGLVATSGALVRGPLALPRNVATELLLTGRSLDAGRLHELGFVNRVAPPGGAVDVALELAAEILPASPEATALTMAALRETRDDAEAAGWRTSDRAFEAVGRSVDAAEGRAAFAAKRPPRWGG